MGALFAVKQAMDENHLPGTIKFFGKTAHASTNPWSGVSAVDVVKLMDVGWDVLREHLPPTQRSHSVIQSNIDLVGMPQWTEEEVNLAKAIQKAAGVPEVGLRTDVPGLVKAVQGTSSNDNGDITWVVPHAHIHFPNNVPGAVDAVMAIHTPDSSPKGEISPVLPTSK